MGLCADKNNCRPVIIFKTNGKISGHINMSESVGTTVEEVLQQVIEKHGKDAVSITTDTADVQGVFGQFAIVKRKDGHIGEEKVITNACYVAFHNKIIHCGLDYPVEVK